MQTATVKREGDRQTVHLPPGCHISGPEVAVRIEGEAIILEPLRSQTWPPGFFDEIHITDDSFRRPAQGDLPPAKPL